MKFVAHALVLALASAAQAGVPAAFEGTAVLKGKLPAGTAMHVTAQYASRLWVPAVSVSAQMPIPVTYQRHGEKSLEFHVKPDAQGHYRLEFPLHQKGKLGMTYLFDAASVCFKMPGQPGETLPTWIVPTAKASVTLGRANIPLSDVTDFGLKTKANLTTTEIHTEDGKTYVGHTVGFPDASGREGTLNVEVR